MALLSYPPPLNEHDIERIYARGEKIYVCSASSSASIIKQIMQINPKAKDIIVNVSEIVGIQYFGLPELYQCEKEIFVDGGAFDGDSTNLFFKWSKAKEKFSYCFEADSENYQKCCRNIERLGLNGITNVINKGLWSKNDTLNFSNSGKSTGKVSNEGIPVKVTSADSELNNNEVTFIKMDIEGAELEALYGCKNIIQKQKPKLAICVYHRPEDLLSIPAYILDLRPDYKLYLRHHTFEDTELVLYAI